MTLEGLDSEIQLEKTQEQWLRQMMAEELRTKAGRVEQLREDIQVLESGIGEKDSRKSELAKAYEEKKKEVE